MNREGWWIRIKYLYNSYAHSKQFTAMMGMFLDKNTQIPRRQSISLARLLEIVVGNERIWVTVAINGANY